MDPLFQDLPDVLKNEVYKNYTTQELVDLSVEGKIKPPVKVFADRLNELKRSDAKRLAQLETDLKYQPSVETYFFDMQPFTEQSFVDMFAESDYKNNTDFFIDLYTALGGNLRQSFAFIQNNANEKDNQLPMPSLLRYAFFGDINSFDREFQQQWNNSKTTETKYNLIGMYQQSFRIGVAQGNVEFVQHLYLNGKPYRVQNHVPDLYISLHEDKTDSYLQILDFMIQQNDGKNQPYNLQVNEYIAYLTNRLLSLGELLFEIKNFVNDPIFEEAAVNILYEYVSATFDVDNLDLEDLKVNETVQLVIELIEKVNYPVAEELLYYIDNDQVEISNELRGYLNAKIQQDQ